MIRSLTRLVARVLASTLLAGSALAAQQWPIPETMKSVDVGGYPLAYIEAGAGTPLVLVHGAWIDARLFQAQIAELSKSYRVIAVSLRHHWPERWDGNGADFTYRQQASDLAALIRQLGLGKAHVLGHSRGGGVALTLALQDPDVVRTLVLAEPFGLDQLLGDASVVQARTGGVRMLREVVRSGLAAGEDRATVAKKAWEMTNGPQTWDRMSDWPRQMIADNIGTMAADQPVEVMPLTCDDLRRLAMPVMLVKSEGAAASYVATMSAASTCRPDWPPAVVVPNARHNMFLDNPSFFSAALLDFLVPR